ncbi:MAG: lactate racemase domain-containing protein [Oscillospiraceae bacterium]|jgi:nickel-dependent lactate racemase|nr:lactate racemase domain-containing protein [Oscillospiraceae bacterium]
MSNIIIENEHGGLSVEQIKKQLAKSIEGRKLKKVLLVPPDITRLNSGAGLITALYYEMLENTHVDILPALGTHKPMTREEQIAFFGEKIPAERYLIHDWRNDVTKIGQVPGKFVKEVSEGLMEETMGIELSNYLLDPTYDLILSIGQVVPHEVVGMANYTKNIVVGCGGSGFINQSHMLGAYYGMERIMGKDHSPVRKVFDYAEENYISKLPLEYVLTVTVSEDEKTDIIGLYIGKERENFTRAVALSQKHNLIYMDEPIKTCVVWLDEREFHSTWLGNKAIYRTRMAIADGGELIILAPGVKMFGEDAENDRLIQKYGYIGRKNILKLCKTEKDLQNNLSTAAHLIHGSTDGRFKVTYATKKLKKEEVEKVAFNYIPLDEALKKYDPKKLKQGYNKTKDGEEIFYIENPALGLWALKLW